MALKKIEQNDIFFNVLKTKPSVSFSIYNGQVTLNNVMFSNSVSGGYAALNDLSIAANSSTN